MQQTKMKICLAIFLSLDINVLSYNKANICQLLCMATITYIAAEEIN